MAKYRCECQTFDVFKATMKVIGGQVVTVEAYCKDCKTYGKFIKQHKGFGSIIKKPDGTVSRKPSTPQTDM